MVDSNNGFIYLHFTLVYTVFFKFFSFFNSVTLVHSAVTVIDQQSVALCTIEVHLVQPQLSIVTINQ
jgi:hypothetical protein